MATRAEEVSNSPLTPEQAHELKRFVAMLDHEGLNWVSGYLAGVARGGVAREAHAPQRETQQLTVLYGSETGNAERLAMNVAELARARNIAVRALDMADYKTRELRDESLLVIITSTHGEGAPPDPAANFYEFLHGRKAPKLDKLKFAVLALGDSSYAHFCQTGRDFDMRLEALGAVRLRQRLDCDVDFAEPAAAWVADAVTAFGAHMEPVAAAPRATVLSFTRPPVTGAYGPDSPFSAEVLENLVLNGRGSERETRHIEISLESSGLEYEPGDVLGVVARNRPAVVEDLIETVGVDPSSTVSSGDTTKTLGEALLTDYEITTVTPRFLEAWAKLSQAPQLLSLLEDDARLMRTRYLDERWPVDVIREHPVSEVAPGTLVRMLRPLQPREYSISSSLKANPDEVHVTVAAVRFRSRGQDRFGVASTFLADAIEPGDRVDVYLRENRHFRLPAVPGTPIIMIGPGTGVAPFRAFLQEREVLGASGRNWLFFGNPRFRTDFLYQTEWQRWLRDSLLSRLDVAFSRDQPKKIYVQHHLVENGAEVYRWLEEGAYVYVCGDAVRMAPDVHAALLEILSRHGALSEDRAQEYLKALQGSKRYQRDIY